MQRIHMMWFYISDCGAKFQKKEYKLLQNVRRIMRESHEYVGLMHVRRWVGACASSVVCSVYFENMKVFA